MEKSLIEGNYKINRKILVPNKGLLCITENRLLDNQWFNTQYSRNTGLRKAILSRYNEDLQ